MNEEEIFHQALAQSLPEERAAYLQQACAGNPAMRASIEALLRANEGASVFMGRPVPALVAASDQPIPEGRGTVIGPYKLLEQIGEGGMGIVYMAEQTQPVRREVALKIIKPGMDTKQVIARFEAERQALAMMDHPNIAKVHDAGATESGRPYFVMELVRGIPITDYCDRERLSIPERLELFVQVCRAVQHAHQKGVIHRDLKPSNILVTVIDGAAVPKVIDFGVAKATGGSLTERTIYTTFHQFVGTPLYMSPEQADLSGMDVDTRSDIYSLGVLLYELLTGTTPFDQDTFRQAAFDEMRRIIREEEPPKPSSRLNSLGASRTTVSANRKADARHLDRAVRGDLDWIVMKALEKDRRRRFETANDFAADVMRYLTDQPVEACPPSVGYRFAKYVRRNRVALTTGALIGLTLVGGTALSAWQAVEARKARSEAVAALVQAQTRADETQHVLDYLVKELIGASGVEAAGRPLTVSELLDRASSDVSKRFAEQPLLEARIQMVLAETYSQTVKYKEAAGHAARAWDIRRRLLGPEDPDTLATRFLEAAMIAYDGYNNPELYTTAEPMAREVFTARRRVLGPAHPDTIRSGSFLSWILCGLQRFDQALALAQQAVALAEANPGAGNRVALEARHELGQVLLAMGDLDASIASLRITLDDCEKHLGPLDEETILTSIHLGSALANSGQFDEARQVLEVATERSSHLYGFCHIKTSYALGPLQDVMRRQGDFTTLRDRYMQWIRGLLTMPVEADQYLRHRRSARLAIMALDLVTLPPSIPVDGELALRAAQEASVLSDRWSGAWSLLGVVHYRLGHLDEAERAIRTAMERKPDPQEHPFDPLVLTLIHARRGDRRRAFAEFGLFQKLPKDKMYLRYLDQLEADARAVMGLEPDADTDGPEDFAP
jgi:eukaryotic-like serine/threonine-protein kinase